MLKPIQPLYDKDNGTGRSKGGQETGELEDGQKKEEVQGIAEMMTKLNELDDKFSSQNKLTDKWANDVGEVRKMGESFSDVATRLSSIEEKLTTKETDELDFDPYNKIQFQEIISNTLKPVIDKLEDSHKNFITGETLTEMVQQAQAVSSVQEEFKITNQQANELNAESLENGKSIRELAHDKYGERLYKASEKDKFNKELSNELKNEDLPLPPDTASDSVFEKFSLPKNQVDFDAEHRKDPQIPSN